MTLAETRLDRIYFRHFQINFENDLPNEDNKKKKKPCSLFFSLKHAADVEEEETLHTRDDDHRCCCCLIDVSIDAVDAHLPRRISLLLSSFTHTHTHTLSLYSQ
jgi:hypothetical protein